MRGLLAALALVALAGIVALSSCGTTGTVDAGLIEGSAGEVVERHNALLSGAFFPASDLNGDGMVSWADADLNGDGKVTAQDADLAELWRFQAEQHYLTIQAAAEGGSDG